MTRTVTLTAYIQLDDGDTQEDAEAIVAAALATDDRIYQVKAERTIELVA